MHCILIVDDNNFVPLDSSNGKSLVETSLSVF